MITSLNQLFSVNGLLSDGTKLIPKSKRTHRPQEPREKRHWNIIQNTHIFTYEYNVLCTEAIIQSQAFAWLKWASTYNKGSFICTWIQNSLSLLLFSGGIQLIYQYWFRWWLETEQAIVWNRVWWHHMALLGHNELVVVEPYTNWAIIGQVQIYGGIVLLCVYTAGHAWKLFHILELNCYYL